MSLFERVEHLDREIATAVERAVSALREELSERLRAGSDELARRLREVEPKLPGSFLRHEDVAPLADEARAEASAGARSSAFAELRDALVAIDGAGSQADVLNALIAEAGRFASRAAVLLTRDGELRGWGGHGWNGGGEAIRGVALTPGGGWSRLVEGNGAVRLSPDECAELSGRLGGAAPREGLAVPLVLRDRVAAVLYADRLEGQPLAVEALQTLVYVASQAIESLPFRQRRGTPTLRLDETAAVPREEPAPAVPPAYAPAPPSPPAVTAPEPPAEAQVGELAGSPEGLALEEAPAPASDLAEDDTAALTAPSPQALAAPSPEALESTDALPWTTEDEGAAPAAATWSSAGEEVEELPALPAVDVDDDVYELPEVEAEHWSEPAAPASEETAPAPWAAASEPAVSPAATEQVPAAQGHETVLLRRPGFDEVDDEVDDQVDEAPAPEAATQAAAYDNVRPLPGADVEAVASGPRPVAVAGGPAGASPEVLPPSGVQGPGWAFATSRLQVSPDEEGRHEEARRLARLLVSEIKLYNEEQVEEGRRNRDIYERLRDDIDRSRQMYEERVDPRLLNTTDYFYQELVRILAAGDSKALGI